MMLAPTGGRRFGVLSGREAQVLTASKASMMAESYTVQEPISAVARPQGMGPSLLLTWRRELRTRMEAQGLAHPVASASAPLFVPAVIANHR
jgi:transposase